MPILRLDQQRKRVNIAEFELDNPVVFDFFNAPARRTATNRSPAPSTSVPSRRHGNRQRRTDAATGEECA
jgi:hypothetical protein